MRAAIITLLVLVVAGRAPAEPQLAVVPKAFNLGSVPTNCTVTPGFWFKSAGVDSVNVFAIKTGCKCSTMPLERDWLAADDSMLVRLVWKTGRRIGAATQVARVFTGPEAEPIYVTIRGQVIPSPDSALPVSIKPYKFELARSETMAIDSLSFTLNNRSSHDLVPAIVSVPIKECTIILPDVIPAGTEAEGHVKIGPGYADSEFMTSVTIGFSENEDTRLTVPIRRKFY